MSTQFYLQFGSGDPRLYAGLTPTFIAFYLPNGTPVTPPAITGFGTSLGVYLFTYNVTTSTAFLVDGSASLVAADRYLFGALDPVQAVDIQLTGVGASLSAQNVTLGAQITREGTTLVAIGNTMIATELALGVSLNALSVTVLAFGVSVGNIAALIGTTASSFGDEVTDPTTVLGYLKRNQEFEEGNAVFTKNSGEWDIYSRGSSVLLRTKSLTNDAAQAAKT